MTHPLAAARRSDPIWTLARRSAFIDARHALDTRTSEADAEHAYTALWGTDARWQAVFVTVRQGHRQRTTPDPLNEGTP